MTTSRLRSPIAAASASIRARATPTASSSKWCQVTNAPARVASTATAQFAAVSAGQPSAAGKRYDYNYCEYTRCADVNECKNETHKVYDDNAHCNNTHGGYKVACNEGYEGDGTPGNCPGA